MNEPQNCFKNRQSFEPFQIIAIIAKAISSGEDAFHSRVAWPTRGFPALGQPQGRAETCQEPASFTRIIETQDH